MEKGLEKGRYSICGYNSLRTIQLTNDTLTLENNKVIKKIKYRGSPLKKIDTIIKNLKFIKSKKLYIWSRIRIFIFWFYMFYFW